MPRILLGLIILGAIGIAFWALRRRSSTYDPAPLRDLPAPAPPVPAPALPAPDTGAPATIFARLHAEALGDERAADTQARPDAAHMPVLLAASREVAQVGSEPRYTPRQPSMLPQIMEAVSDEDASLRALSRTIAQDPELTSELLRTANSALYRVSPNPVESIERATALIGTRGIRTLITAALMKPLAGAGGGGTGKFGEVMWEHSRYSASAAEAFAARSQDCDPYTAHLLGLMHGLGSVAVYRAIMGQYQAHPALTPDAAAISQSLAAQSGVTAARIAANWGLSARTQAALEAQSSAAPAAADNPLAHALRFGRIAAALVLLCTRGKMTTEEGWQELLAAGFDPAQVQRIWERLAKAYVSAK